MNTKSARKRLLRSGKRLYTYSTTYRYKKPDPEAPLRHFNHSISSTNSLADMYTELRRFRGLGPRGRLPPEHHDLLWLPRSAVVVALSSLDAYVHAVLEDRIPIALKLTPIPDRLCDAMSKIVPIKNAASFRDAFPLISSIQVEQKLAEKLQKQTLSYTAYQAPRGILNAYEMIGYPKIFDSVSASWPGPSTTSDDIKRILSNYCKRRNQIVHEGDREKSGKVRPMQSKYAITCTKFIMSLVSRLNRIVYDS